MDVVDELLEEWQLTRDGDPAGVLPVRTRGGRPAVLKLGAAAHEHLALQHWHGAGAPQRRPALRGGPAALAPVGGARRRRTPRRTGPLPRRDRRGAARRGPGPRLGGAPVRAPGGGGSGGGDPLHRDRQVRPGLISPGESRSGPDWAGHRAFANLCTIYHLGKVHRMTRAPRRRSLIAALALALAGLVPVAAPL